MTTNRVLLILGSVKVWQLYVALFAVAIAALYLLLPFHRYSLVPQNGAHAPVYEINHKTGEVWDVTGAERRRVP